MTRQTVPRPIFSCWAVASPVAAGPGPETRPPDRPPDLHIRLAEYKLRCFLGGVHLLPIYDCLCDATRLRLLHLLAVRPLCVCHIEAVLRLPQAKISRHLAYLRRHRLVTTEQRGPWRIYALAAPPPPALAANLACLQDALTTEPVLRRDRERLDRLAAQVDCGCATPEVPRRKLLRLTR